MPRIGAHELDGAGVPFDLLAVKGAQRGHAADVRPCAGAEHRLVAGGFDLQREQGILHLAFHDPRGRLILPLRHLFERPHREERKLAAKHGNDAMMLHRLDVERRELRALPGDEPRGDRTLDLGIIDGENR
jgi:hypothetical protein